MSAIREWLRRLSTRASNVEVDTSSFLLGVIAGLGIAFAVASLAVILAPSERPTAPALAASGPTASATRLPMGVPTPSPTATATPAPTATATPRPAPTNTPRPSPTVAPTATASPAPVHSDTVFVPPRASQVYLIPTQAGQLLDLTVQVDSDIDLTVIDPSGALAAEPLRVRGSYSLQARASTTGSWILKLGNTFSWISTKQVHVLNRLLPAR